MGELALVHLLPCLPPACRGQPDHSQLNLRSQGHAAGGAVLLRSAASIVCLPAGDSLTTLNLRSQGNAAVSAQWQALFAGRRTLPLGMNGCTVEWLAWRIVQGGERPAKAPKVIALLIG